MSRTKAEVKIDDHIYIYKIFGYSEYNESTGVVSLITEDNYIYGSWGDIPLTFSDDWKII